MRGRRVDAALGGICALTVVACAACTGGSGPAAEPEAGAGGVDVQVLSLSTWLGQLDPISVTDDAGVTREYGGLPALSSYFAADRAASPNTLLLAGPDSFGASPPLSSRFQDEPTVEALGLLGATCDTLSNHDFDNGIAYLQHLVALSAYPYVSTNMNGIDSSVSPAIQAPYLLAHAGPATIGVLGVTNPDAPNHVTPGYFGSITISEPVAAANAAASAARQAGAQSVIVVTDLETTAIDDAGVHSGPLIDMAAGLRGVDVILGYNQNSPGTPRVGNVLVVEHTWKGLTYGRTHLHLNVDGTVSSTAEVVLPDVSLVAPDADAGALLAPYRSQLSTLFDSAIDVATSVFPLDGSERTQEVALGDLLTDAMLAKYAPEGAQLAVFNGAGIRATLPSTYAPADLTLRRPASGYAAGPPYDVVVGDAYAILPFGDMCVVRPVTGAVLWSMLEQSVYQEPAEFTGFLQISGFEFTYQASAPPGARVTSVTLADGTSVARDDARTWILADSDYLDSGGDGYGMLIQSPAAPTRDVVAEVLLAYLETSAPLTPALSGRITRLP